MGNSVMTSEERIKKLRQEVDSLRDLLDKSEKRRADRNGDPDAKPVLPSQKRKIKPKIKKEDDIPPF